ncbi:cytochrome b subunit of succinate dehydrogenase, Sdh3p [Saxophila tyrrhenica]|uniref:Cytochrome b subunit of succinate dehydrogenase, Sdh3p n=1 Tax=Saxophila tyrrhenica TaxID=1690608 RepID=A0AAV9NYC0_9PEZI|nr:cytochrome b subunit of succinate dehydrogenase, Sdh3p [Saxophila tyrrhenica]
MLAQRAAQQSLRRLTAQTITETTEHDKILAQQRLNRPVAPHLGIYAPQIPWYLSALNRITGCTLSGAFYVFGSLYLVAPYIGLHMESASVAAAFGAWPWLAKVATKMFFALPFTFHSFNGLRHLAWDTTHMITNQKVITSGWTVVGLSVVSAFALTFI